MPFLLPSVLSHNSRQAAPCPHLALQCDPKPTRPRRAHKTDQSSTLAQSRQSLSPDLLCSGCRENSAPVDRRCRLPDLPLLFSQAAPRASLSARLPQMPQCHPEQRKCFPFADHMSVTKGGSRLLLRSTVP